MRQKQRAKQQQKQNLRQPLKNPDEQVQNFAKDTEKPVKWDL